jgi:TonB family protein
MRYLMFVILLAHASSAKSQPCNDHASLTRDKAGASMYAFTEHVDIKGENGHRLFSIYGFIWETSLVLTVEVVDEYQCFGLEDKVVLVFSDGSSTEGQNAFTNCERQLAIQINEGQSQLEYLKSKPLAALQVVTKTGVRAEANIDHQKAERLRLSVLCLSSFKSRTPVRDSLEFRNLFPAQISGDSSLVYTVVEYQPEFFGGYGALMEFIEKNFRIKAKRGTKGRVLISFIVDKDGQIIDAQVLESFSREVDAEALRVVKMMPRWKPGLQNGKPVSVRFVLPIKL